LENERVFISFDHREQRDGSFVFAKAGTVPLFHEKAEMGIYGLVSANGFSEYLTGKDMFGNTLTDEQRQASLLQSIIGPALIAAPFAP
jgi:hypothetical protein